VLCCDASKGDETNLTINPLDQSMMQYIAYKKNCIIYCLPTAGPKSAAIHRDLNDILRLNGYHDRDTATGLLKGRRDAYRQAQGLCKDLLHRKRLSSAQIRKTMQRIAGMEEYPEFAGAILFFLDRKRKHLESQGK